MPPFKGALTACPPRQQPPRAIHSAMMAKFKRESNTCDFPRNQTVRDGRTRTPHSHMAEGLQQFLRGAISRLPTAQEGRTCRYFFVPVRTWRRKGIHFAKLKALQV